MFGIALASIDQIPDESKRRYQSLYCGLCKALLHRYGQIPRIALNYDLTFYTMLFNSLFEPEEELDAKPCLSHPMRDVDYAISKYSYEAADISVIFAFHKCLDDIDDDNAVSARVGKRALKSAYMKARSFHPILCEAMERSHARMRAYERDPLSPPDATTREFGSLMAMVFSFDKGIWKSYLEEFGYHLGRFIYLMDAAIDYEDDIERGSYNPFIATDVSGEDLRSLLEDIACSCAHAFEKLPLERDLELLRSVIYAGMWQKMNLLESKKSPSRSKVAG